MTATLPVVKAGSVRVRAAARAFLSPFIELLVIVSELYLQLFKSGTASRPYMKQELVDEYHFDKVIKKGSEFFFIPTVCRTYAIRGRNQRVRVYGPTDNE
ncbi:MAG: hypothetical protein KGI71_02585, partial [Patescibacteria group bacterium]|nr:hypothetical protein [Patescibacteria group bacterium]